MNKKLERGFSLVELLVVVAIISIIAGVGVTGYEQYVDASKKRLAETNLRNVKEYIRVETTVLNNQILNESPTVKVGNQLWTMGTNTLDQFLNGAAQYHDLGTGLANFKNPYKNSDIRQVYSASNASDIADINYATKGSIVLRVNPSYPSDGSKVNGVRNFQVIFYKDDNIIDSDSVKNFELK